LSLWTDLRVGWQSFKTRRKMNRQFGRREDPFSYGETPYELARLDAMQAALSGPRWNSVLEAGCAEGHFTQRLARLADRVTALDISAVALSRARRRVPTADFAEGDLLTWTPPAGTSYDAIVLGDVLYYLDREGVSDVYAEVFARIASWLKPGGRLILAHGYAGDEEFAHRRCFRERFEAAGLRLICEAPVDGAERGAVRCLLSVLSAR